jgi:hypothetical protein
MKYSVAVLFLALLLGLSCHSTKPVAPTNGMLNISLADVSFKEVWIKQKIGKLAHYSRPDIEYLFNFNQPTVLLLDAALFNTEVFVRSRIHKNLTLINHGKFYRAKKL